jgi:glutathione S-transferase
VTLLQEQDIKTREVLGWQGLHLLHADFSTCSQKTRIFLNLKGIDWVSHPVDLAGQKNYTPWFLGINPRGLVPVLVHDGAVHIESNDILTYLEATFPEPRLIPAACEEEMRGLLKEEDDLHMDVRALTMRFVVPRTLATKKPQALATYEEDLGTVGGTPDPHKQRELDFWNEYAVSGTTDERARTAAHNFKRSYETLEERLRDHPYLMGDALTLLDIAWWIYTDRLSAAAYPFARLHPRIHAWYQGLLARPEFAKEVVVPAPLRVLTMGLHAVQSLRGQTLSRVAGF